MRSIFLIRQLEQRWMFDGAAVGDVVEATIVTDNDSDDSPVIAAYDNQTSPEQVVFIDGAIGDIDAICEALPTGAQVIVLDPVRDGVTQVSEALNGFDGLASVHIISHGSVGSLELGDSTLDDGNIDTYKDALTGWGEALADTGDILLYGCSVGAGGAGASFIDTFAELTGADVAASDDLTGIGALGGDWNLEKTSGAIETTSITATGYDGLLAADFSISTEISSTWTNDVYAKDMDGDGDIDILSVKSSDVSWWENDGNESFTKNTVAAETQKLVFAIDVDKDGDMDFITGNNSTDTVSWYDNNGSEVFTKKDITTAADSVRSIYAVDVDGDGDIDVLSASKNDDTIAWYDNNGSEVFTEKNITTAADGAYSVYAVDVDGDGDIDVLSASSVDDTIAWYDNDGSEVFTKKDISTVANGSGSVFAVDLDGDGDIDVLSSSNSDNTLEWYDNDGSESFTEKAITNAAGNNVYAIDVDGDGDIDVLSKTDAKVLWFDNNGSETFTKNILADSCVTNTINVLDLDGDGDMDIITSAGDNEGVTWLRNIPTTTAPDPAPKSTPPPEPTPTPDAPDGPTSDAPPPTTTTTTVIGGVDKGFNNFTFKPPTRSVGIGGFRTSVADASMRSTTGGDVLAVARPIGLIAQVGEVNFTISSDAFAHTDANATVQLTAQQADGTVLPSWLNFNPMSGGFEGTPPAGASGVVDIQVIARDSDGREAMQVFRIEIGEEELQLEGTPEGQQPEQQPPAPEGTEATPEAAPEPEQPAPEQQGAIDFKAPFKAAASTSIVGKVSLTQQLQQASINGGGKIQPLFSQGMS